MSLKIQLLIESTKRRGRFLRCYPEFYAGEAKFTSEVSQANRFLSETALHATAKRQGLTPDDYGVAEYDTENGTSRTRERPATQ